MTLEGVPIPVDALAEKLRARYCGPAAAEFVHLTDPEKVRWLDERMATLEGFELRPKEQRAVWTMIARAELFESFLSDRYSGAKRFSLEGAEALIPGLQSLVETAAERGVEQIVVGMAHRGRLNILHSVFAKPLAAICAEMRSEGASDFNVGDVRYHLGARAEVRVPFAED